MRDDGTIGSPTSKQPYFRPTTADQRRLMFSVYAQTDRPRQAGAATHVCLGTFYRWRPRFLAGGYTALEEPGSHRPHSSPNQLPKSYVNEVIAAKREPPAWGKRRGPGGAPDELAKGHGWQAVVSASQVRRVLIAAGLWPERVRPAKRGAHRPARRRTGPSRKRGPLLRPGDPCTNGAGSGGQWVVGEIGGRSGHGERGGTDVAGTDLRAGGFELLRGDGRIHRRSSD
jgi:hypothetical protein